MSDPRPFLAGPALNGTVPPPLTDGRRSPVPLQLQQGASGTAANGTAPANTAPPGSGPADPDAWKVAQALEATFLNEMLNAAGLGEVPDAFGGGIGEEQFASFLRQQQAEAMVAAGGIGLAETIYQSMLEKSK